MNTNCDNYTKKISYIDYDVLQTIMNECNNLGVYGIPFYFITNEKRGRNKEILLNSSKCYFEQVIDNIVTEDELLNLKFGITISHSSLEKLKYLIFLSESIKKKKEEFVTKIRKGENENVTDEKSTKNYGRKTRKTRSRKRSAKETNG